MPVACCLLGGCLLSGSLHAALPVVEMTSLEWPPYTGETIAEHGIVGKYAVDAFSRMGYQLKISYFPWRRAVRYLEESSRYVGFFPEYSSRICQYCNSSRQRQFFTDIAGCFCSGGSDRQPDGSGRFFK